MDTLDDFDDKAPPEFLCPITKTIMKDPVIMADGQTYEREAIKTALEINPISPMTRQPMSMSQARNNYAIKNMIERFIQENTTKNETNQGLNENLNKLMSFGFDRESSQIALIRSNNNIRLALDFLVNKQNKIDIHPNNKSKRHQRTSLPFYSIISISLILLGLAIVFYFLTKLTQTSSQKINQQQNQKPIQKNYINQNIKSVKKFNFNTTIIIDFIFNSIIKILSITHDWVIFFVSIIQNIFSFLKDLTIPFLQYVGHFLLNFFSIFQNLFVCLYHFVKSKIPVSMKFINFSFQNVKNLFLLLLPITKKIFFGLCCVIKESALALFSSLINCIMCVKRMIDILLGVAENDGASHVIESSVLYFVSSLFRIVTLPYKIIIETIKLLLSIINDSVLTHN